MEFIIKNFLHLDYPCGKTTGYYAKMMLLRSTGIFLGPVYIWGTDILSQKISNTDETISIFTRLTLRDCVPDRILHIKFKMRGFDMHFFFFPFLRSHVVPDHSVNYRDTSGYFTHKCLGQESPA
jgi:hypothetical protein